MRTPVILDVNPDPEALGWEVFTPPVGPAKLDAFAAEVESEAWGGDA